MEASTPDIKPGLVEALATAYAALVKRQRTASSAFVRWSTANRRAHEFAWMEPGRETLMTSGRELRIGPGSAIHDQLNKMMATIELNPYERELLYGYPYVIGQSEGVAIRGPLLTIPISISAQGGILTIRVEEDLLRFNSLPFRSDFETAGHELALGRLIEQTPEYPLRLDELRTFAEALSREMKTTSGGRLDGSLASAPSQPRATMSLTVVDNAACFVAPKTGYFLASDLTDIAKVGVEAVAQTALGWLIGSAGGTRTSDEFGDSRRIYFPFGSNKSQRHVAVLADDPNNQIIVVQGPPGTGKSLTIANVACHLVARNKRVLICAQKDKAMEVVDAKLRELDLAQLPMTLLRQDRDSKQELRGRLESIQKTRSTQETETHLRREEQAHQSLVGETEADEAALENALVFEEVVAKADLAVAGAPGWLPRLQARWARRAALRRADRRAPDTSDVLGERTTAKRAQLLAHSVRILGAAADNRTGEATRAERNQLREFSKLLGRNQTTFRNFSIFDRLKSDPSRCQMLLKILPCWIMSPDDVARLFPCTPGLFDVVIIDEASQCDLPSMTPVLYRAKQAIIAGDSKQMQAQRFAFTSGQVAAQAWREQGLHNLDPDGWLDPSKIDLLQLAAIRGSEEVFLDEHFRSLPGIISFSNDRWYRSRMRLMRDPDDRQVGDPDAPTMRLHHVSGGLVTPGRQENPQEAQALVSELRRMVANPGYASATFGVVCLFEEQMRLMNELVGAAIDEEARQAHDLVVVNPDGFQGDERDVILYSLSYDAMNMEQAALSARQADREHIQGMLNVAFTRAREEVHVFHSAPIDSFGMASGEGTLLDWLRHCARIERTSFDPTAQGLIRTESEFEADVTKALQSQGVRTLAQYPSCGFRLDVVAEKDGRRVAIECDGEIWHEDEHGELKVEDVQRQEILERAGWRVLRIPYRRWRLDSAAQIARVIRALAEPLDGEEAAAVPPMTAPPGMATHEAISVDTNEAAVLRALRSGMHDREEVINAARVNLGKSRMGAQIRRALETAILALGAKGLLVSEESELFATDDGRTAILSTYTPRVSSGRKRRPYGYRRRW
jgi:very-short-patch-repair endonuclease/phosphate starvation-inducible protein PhoH